MKRDLTTVAAACLLGASIVAAQVQRPAHNTGTGFFVSGGKIYDGNGNLFIPLGVNSAEAWHDGTCEKRHFSSSLPKSGANTVRLCALTNASENAWSWNSNPATHRELVKLCVDNKLVPMLEMHDATCNKPIGGVVSYWLRDDMVQLCKDYEKYLMVNIANENDWPSPEAWRDGYINIIKQLRAKGVKNLIVVDAHTNCGQNPDGIINRGQELIDGDPQKNVALSVHMYSFWYTGTGAGWQFKVQDKLAAMAAKNLPVMVGEFAWIGPSAPYDPKVLLSECAKHGFGWLFWSFGGDLEHQQIIKDECTGYRTDADLSQAGLYLVPYFKANARVATVFGTVPPLPPLPSQTPPRALFRVPCH